MKPHSLEMVGKCDPQASKGGRRARFAGGRFRREPMCKEEPWWLRVRPPSGIQMPHHDLFFGMAKSST